ncbi:probable starch synthase 4, chloroplastic/amyloplastic isoform X2 [Asparagus officinalis]|uniref:probable starch synthase 4, chloroplastic/amyloplastic isoform X2 n=1 Tax=Asparagus officinalis TaxID=4686 RepID=UPI00098E845B|nr:probable starch synthase 4, chloroplastic/amyloplastic isoform X2 [Asparagus officinalis]
MESMANAITMVIAPLGAPPLNSSVRFRSKSRRIWCSRLESNDKDKFEGASSPSETSVQISNDNIWKLFNDAQQNIMHLNKQRLVALEELKKVQHEKQLLLERLEQLEARNQAGTTTKSVESWSISELLLRIDSMVLSDMIGTGEAADLRKSIVENRFAVDNLFFGIQEKNDLELLSELRHFSETIMRKPLHVVHICSEMEPIASSSPLASYVTGVSSALQRKGNMVEVILPKYASINLAPIKALRKIEGEVDSYFGGRWHRNRIWTGIINNIGVALIEPLHHQEFFNRDLICGYSDDFKRFAYFSRASLDYLVKSGKQPDILHIHNWETAIIGPLFWDIFVHQGLSGTRLVFTCHDLNSQCLEQPDKLETCGLDSHRLHRADRLQDNINKNLINILKGGIVYSNKVVFVSSSHSIDKIIQCSGHELEPTLAVHRDKLLITPYGFDGTNFDPSKDKFLPAKYSANNIEGKALCKVALRHHLGFSKHSFAIVGCIFSEVSDGDVDNLRLAIMYAMEKGAQFVLMGGTVMTPTLQLLQEELKETTLSTTEWKNGIDVVDLEIWNKGFVVVCGSVLIEGFRLHNFMIIYFGFSTYMLPNNRYCTE